MEISARFFIALGLGLAGAGCLVLLLARLPGWNDIPGDFVYRRDHFTFFFPLKTSLLLSILLSLILFLAGRFR